MKDWIFLSLSKFHCDLPYFAGPFTFPGTCHIFQQIAIFRRASSHPPNCNIFRFIQNRWPLIFSSVSWQILLFLLVFLSLFIFSCHISIFRYIFIFSSHLPYFPANCQKSLDILLLLHLPYYPVTSQYAVILNIFLHLAIFSCLLPYNLLERLVFL